MRRLKLSGDELTALRERSDLLCTLFGFMGEDENFRKCVSRFFSGENR